MDKEFLRGSRTGLDFDKKDIVTQLKVLRAYLMMTGMGVKVKVEETEHGWHVKMATGRHIWNLRYLFGDDPMRIQIDEERERVGLTHWRDTLFIGKNGVLIQPYDPLSEPFWIPRTIKKRRRRWKKK